MQITRERIRPETQITTSETCVTCAGTGTMENSTNFIAKLENQLEYYWDNMNAQGLMIKANPLIVSYIKEGFPSRRMKWWWKYKKWLRVESDETYPINMIDYYDRSESEIK
jgi:ribonuclease G